MPKEWMCGTFSLPLGKRPLLMGILNVTPDSFSDGGQFDVVDAAVEHALAMANAGADIIDIGGESTRPGSKGISAEEEIERVVPVIQALMPKLKIPISIDTSKAAVAEAALRAGASMVNDVTALKDVKMAGVVAKAGVPVVLMHMRGTPKTMQKATEYKRLIPEIQRILKRSIQVALEAGIPKHQILLDPGIGFGKGLGENLRLIQHIPEFKAMGFPVLMGVSRKSFIEHALEPVEKKSIPTEDRQWGTASAVACSVYLGADILRVHDVAEMKQVCVLGHAIRRGEKYASAWR